MATERYYVSVFGDVNGPWQSWLDWAQDVANQLALPLNYIGSSVAGRPVPSKVTTFDYARVVRRFQQQPIVAAELYSVPASFKQLAFDWQLELSRDAGIGRVFLGCDIDSCSWERFIEVSTSLFVHIVPAYGFGGKVSRLAGPAVSSLGTGTGRETATERAELIRWRKELGGSRRFEQGLLRSVYPLNILSSHHLVQPIGNSTLMDEIESCRLPGVLSSTIANARMWKVEESDIPTACEVLSRNGLLL